MKKPLNEKTDYKFSDLVDIEEFKKILENFYDATAIPNGLVGNKGEIISQAGWSKACRKFHRTNLESKTYCEESNLELMKKLSNGKANRAVCKNGLVDYATPIIIEGECIATLFLGQVLNKAPDLNFFRKQAKRFSYDEDEYLNAIKKIPVVSEDKIKSLLECIVMMAKMLANTGLARLHETRLRDKLNKTREQTIQLKDVLDFSPIGIGWSNLNGDIEYINHQFTKLFGYTLGDIPNLKAWYEKAYPDKIYRKNIIDPWNKEVNNSYKNGKLAPEIEVSVVCKNGMQRRVFIRVSWVGDKRLVSFSDITAHWQSELRNRAHDAMLEMVAKDSSLTEILHRIVYTIETEDPTALCSILLLDSEHKHLFLGASPNLPDFYNNAINGVEIGMGIGSCGTAAFMGERIIVEDITKHKYWQNYKDLAQKAGVSACWSEPIISSTGNILGTFAIYHSTPTLPDSNDIERISFAANLAAIAIENRNARVELEQRAYYDYLTQLSNRRSFIEKAELELTHYNKYGGEISLIMFDIDHFKKINDTYGHNMGDVVLQKIADICRIVLRDVDIIGRIGGEEFAILLPKTDIVKAQKIAERLRETISNSEVKVKEIILSTFTASFGVVTNNAKMDIDGLLVKADDALYKAKNSGRNKVICADF